MAHYIDTCAPAEAPRSRNLAPSAILAWFRAVVKRRRQERESTAILDTYSDRMLADIGLRRDHLAPRPESDAMLAQGGCVRISRYQDAAQIPNGDQNP
jgi:uncharacterized protein YjiS (DUF1127 family)